MKRVVKPTGGRALYFTLFFFLMRLAALAQSDSISASNMTPSSSSEGLTTTGSHNNMWYTQPWAWILGATIFILLLVALLSNAKKTNGANEETMKPDTLHNS